MDIEFSPAKKKRLPNTKKLVDALNHAFTLPQRTTAIDDINSEFDHFIEAIHDSEVRAGAANALCLQLGYVLHRGTGVDCHEMIRNICRGIELVYRCSDAIRNASFLVIGIELLPLLLKSIERFIHDNTMIEYDETVYCVMKVMHSFSMVASAKVEMARHSCLLDSIVAIITGGVPEEVKIEAIATIDNLSAYGDECSMMLVKQPGLIQSLVEVCHCSNSNNAKAYAVSTLRNIALSPYAKLTLAEHGSVINALIRLSGDSNVKIRRNAASTIGSLSSAVENSARLVSHCEGALIDALIRMTGNDVDPSVRRRATRSLKCLGCGYTAELMVNHRGLIDTITNSALHDPNIDARFESAQALASLAAESATSKRLPDNVLCALVAVSSSDTIPCVNVVVKAFLQQAKIPENRALMGNHFGLLQAITKIMCTDYPASEIRENATSVLFELVKCEENRANITSSKYVLSALVKVLSFHGSAITSCQDFAVDILAQLALLVPNRRILAKFDGLLVSLVQYSASSSDLLRKDIAKKIIMKLVPAM